MLCCRSVVFHLRKGHLENDHEDKSKVVDGRAGQTWRILADWKSIAFLILLYTLQGLPLGLMGSISLIIQDKNGSYSDQAKFAMSYWPLSLKLLWAPLVDALYFKRFGKRKSWLVPSQFLIAVMLLFLSIEVDKLLESMETGILTMLFFCLVFLVTTQDITVDGWAINMLKKEHVGIASTCNIVGLTLGKFIGYSVFLNLASPDFSNKYLRNVPNNNVGVVTLSSFLLILSVVYFVCTTLIIIFKKEEPIQDDGEKENNPIISCYVRLWDILQLPAVRKCALFLFTCSIGFAADNELSSLKLVEAGISKEVLAQLNVPLIPISLIVTILISKWTAGANPMRLYMMAYFFGLTATGVISAMVWVTKHLNETTDGNFPAWYFPCIIGIQAVYGILSSIMGVAQMSFIAKISDPAHGATFVTLYYTIGNLGGTIPSAIALWLVDPLTVTSCRGEVCNTKFDGYYVEIIACIILGFGWMFWGNATIKKLQEEPESSWRLGNIKEVDGAISA